MKYEDAINQSKPIAMLIYANWADEVVPSKQAFNNLAIKYANKYNFVTINIGTEEAKAFNKTYTIYADVPYLLLFKDRGRFSRYIKRDCLLNESCINGKLDIFAN